MIRVSLRLRTSWKIPLRIYSIEEEEEEEDAFPDLLKPSATDRSIGPGTDNIPYLSPWYKSALASFEIGKKSAKTYSIFIYSSAKSSIDYIY